MLDDGTTLRDLRYSNYAELPAWERSLSGGPSDDDYRTLALDELAQAGREHVTGLRDLVRQATNPDASAADLWAVYVQTAALRQRHGTRVDSPQEPRVTERATEPVRRAVETARQAVESALPSAGDVLDIVPWWAWLGLAFAVVGGAVVAVDAVAKTVLHVKAAAA